MRCAIRRNPGRIEWRVRPSLILYINIRRRSAYLLTRLAALGHRLGRTLGIPVLPKGIARPVLRGALLFLRDHALTVQFAGRQQLRLKPGHGCVGFVSGCNSSARTLEPKFGLLIRSAGSSGNGLTFT